MKLTCGFLGYGQPSGVPIASPNPLDQFYQDQDVSKQVDKQVNKQFFCLV